MSGSILNFLFFPGGLFALALGLLMLSLKRIVIAKLQGRIGPPIYQNVVDVFKLFNKEILIPVSGKDFIFMYAPLLGFSALLVILYFIPIPGVYNGVGYNSDLIILIYLMALPSIAHILGGIASDSPYAAIAVNRELKLMVIYEIIFVIISFAVAIYVGEGKAVFSLNKIIEYQLEHRIFLFDWKFFPAFLGFIIFVLATLELPPFQIAHHNDADVMDGFLIEHNSIPLAIYEMTDGLKVVLLSIILQIFFCPSIIIEGEIIVNLILFIIKTVLFVIFLGFIYVNFPSFRIDQAFKFLIYVPTSLALTTLILVLLSVKGGL